MSASNDSGVPTSAMPSGEPSTAGQTATAAVTVTPIDPGIPLPITLEPPAPERYRVVRPLGRGSLGEVSVAVDSELPREVAYKQVQSKYAPSASHRADFLREATLTGSLEHPGVVPVYSLGTDAGGEPFYAMRLIRGRSMRAEVAEFHRDSGDRPDFRSLAFRRLLSRFVSVCQAIGYAHSRGVIHRDIKPDNVMLGDFGETLVVDWGLAKRVGEGERVPRPDDEDDADAVRTRYGTLKGSIAYMPPEQAAGELDRLGPASDVFALGATLFESLTGRHPASGRKPLDHLALLRAGELPGPRSASGRVPAALDAVCRKAMAFDPADRYESAEAVAAEVERWLSDERVHAHREPPHRVALRQARRHPGAVAGVGAALVMGVVALLAGLWLVDGQRRELAASNNRETLARASAEGRLGTAMEAVDTYLRVVTNEPELRSGNFHALRARLLKAAVPLYRRLAEDAGDTPDQRRAEAQAHWMLGSVARDTGDAAEAEARSAKAVDMYDRLVATDPENDRLRVDLGGCLSNLGRTILQDEGAGRAVPLLERAAATLEPVATRSDRATHFLAMAVLNLRNARLKARDPAGAAPHYERAAALLEPLHRRSGDPDHALGLGQALNNLSQARDALKDAPGALEAQNRCLALRQRLADADPADPRHRAALAGSFHSVGNLLYSSDPAAARAAYARAAELGERLAREQDAVVEHRLELATSLYHVGNLTLMDGRSADAEAPLTRSVALFERLLRDAQADPVVRLRLGRSLFVLGNVVNNLGRPEEASPYHARSIELLSDPSLDASSLLALAHWGRARAVGKLNRHRDALPDWDAAVRLSSGRNRNNRRGGRMFALARSGETARALEEARSLVADLPREPAARHDAARAAAIAWANGGADEAAELAARWLREAAGMGWFRDPKRAAALLADPDFARLRSVPTVRAALDGAAPAERLPVRPRG